MAKAKGSDKPSRTKAGATDKPDRARAGGAAEAGRSRASGAAGTGRSRAGVAAESRVLFSRGLFEVAIPRTADTRVKLTDFQISGPAARVFTLGGSLSANSKTFGPFDGKITHDETGELIATLDDVRATVTRMTGQQGQSFLMYMLEFFLTSHGWRTGKLGELGYQQYGTPHQVLFQNGAGGTMHYWGPNPFVLECSDNRKYKLFNAAEHYAMGWFDDWAGYTHYIHGPFFRC